MQTLHTSPLTPEFEFAGFTFPRYLAILPRGTFAKRLERRKPVVCGQYYSAPKPLDGRDHWHSFYLGSDGFIGRDWQWCDEVDGSRIRHTGWFCDEFQDSKIRGIIVSLSHGRFLAGWSMGESMASSVECRLFDDAVEAAEYADGLAEQAAEREREYQLAVGAENAEVA